MKFQFRATLFFYNNFCRIRQNFIHLRHRKPKIAIIMKTTDPINTRTARDYWNLVQKTDDDTTTPQDTAIMDDDDDEDIANEDLLPPYTMEEIYERLAQSERDYAEGRYQLLSDALDELSAKFARKDAMKKSMSTNMELELAEAV